MELQHNLLRELQYRDYGAASAHPQVQGEVRFLMSTSENLAVLIEQGRLRQELFHRISAVSLMLPPLRHRGTDIELLAESFRARYSQEFHKPVAGFTRDEVDILQRHDWPGNVRELEAAIRRSVAMCNGPGSPPAIWRRSSIITASRAWALPLRDPIFPWASCP